ncbi:MAG: putative sigma-54 modulation protein [Miltoncostaeaceae bacterium]|jgi:putative sigma-54 modulation protein|nr:putative sigma-54 modulation protein [Miltoncostaeaceae bacterium]
MQLQVKGRNMDVTDALFDHAERKLGKLARFLPPWDEATQVELELSVERNPKIDRPQIAEVTVRTKGPVLRVRESAEDMYQAIDQAAHKLERQAARYRDRRRRRRGGVEPGFDGADGALATVGEVIEPASEPQPRLIKSKRFDMQAMSPEDAALQMDLLAHDFYVFRNEDDGMVNVVYRRRDGDYGLIAPEA